MNRTKKFKLISAVTALLLSVNAVSASAIKAPTAKSSTSNEKLYQGYVKRAEDRHMSIIRIVDGKGSDGEDNIVYCYDHSDNFPTSFDSESKTYYTKIESYLNSDDPYTQKYGEEKKKRIAVVLAGGYPLDSYGLLKKHNLTPSEAIDMTQSLIWDINENKEGEYSVHGNTTQKMVNYYNELWKYSKTEKFEQGKLSLKGKLEFSKSDDNVYWKTGKLSAIGNKGGFEFINLPEGMNIVDANKNEVINGNIDVGQEFYLKSNKKPDENLKLKIKYKYKYINLYFYKYHSGGIYHRHQNLVRGELGDTIKEIILEIKVNGDFEYPEIGGTTPNLPGEEGERPDLPGDGGIGGITPNLPGENGERPDLPGENGETPTPQAPDKPEVPQTPDKPEIPQTPNKPETPNVPNKPQVPQTPNKPEVPPTPHTPEKPQVPQKPETPHTSDKPHTSQSSGSSYTPSSSGENKVHKTTYTVEKNNTNPKTGDESIIGFIIIGIISSVGLIIIRKLKYE